MKKDDPLLVIDKGFLDGVDYANRFIQTYFHVSRPLLVGLALVISGWSLIVSKGSIPPMLRELLQGTPLMVLLMGMACIAILQVVLAVPFLLLGMVREPPYPAFSTRNLPEYRNIRRLRALITCICFGCISVAFLYPFIVIWYALLLFAHYLLDCHDIAPEDRVRLFKGRKASAEAS